jgi:hypothetical protein
MSEMSRRDALQTAAVAAGAVVVAGAAASTVGAAPEGGRMAQIFMGTKDDKRAVHVMHPGGLSPEEIERIDKVLVYEVIRDLTGCSCLSGTIDVIWEKNFDRVLDVQL